MSQARRPPDDEQYQIDPEDADDPPLEVPIGGVGGGEQSSLLRVLSESEIPDGLTGWVSETNQDHILGKMTEAEIWERKFNLKNNEEFVASMFPPEESIIQGDFREEHFEFLPGAKEPLTWDTMHQLSDSLDAAYARSTRSRDGWQQEMLTKQIQENIRRDPQRDGSGASTSSGGLLSKWLGGGR